MRRSFAFVAVSMLALGVPGHAKVVGWTTPAEPITEDRIAGLPETEQLGWRDYLARSRTRLEDDRRRLATERASLATLPSSPKAGSPRSMPLDRPADWYAGDEARRVAANILSFQTPSGGWSKNQDRSAPRRLPGQSFAVTQGARIAAMPGAKEPAWSYVGTIDNGATHSEMRFLARIQRHAPGIDAELYRKSFLRGLDYLLDAQFPNGGWPQIYPLQGGYHDAITFNDDAIVEVIELLADVAGHAGDFGFIPPADAERAHAAVERAAAMILRAQVRVDGKPTIWAQQHDALTLAPVGARNFEPAALASDESVGLILFLRSRPADERSSADAARNASAWLAARAIRDMAWGPGDDAAAGRVLRSKAGAAALWPRYFDLGSGAPIFGDRDKSIHDDVNDISRERRNGYSWFSRRPCKLDNSCSGGR